ncbi:MAG: hypothetical protein U5K76_04670 [Woeseiaceae bacterium]|nr:hypothetical protein [Woeseiaceae bacterium]
MSEKILASVEFQECDKWENGHGASVASLMTQLKASTRHGGRYARRCRAGRRSPHAGPLDEGRPGADDDETCALKRNPASIPRRGQSIEAWARAIAAAYDHPETEQGLPCPPGLGIARDKQASVTAQLAAMARFQALVKIWIWRNQNMAKLKQDCIPSNDGPLNKADATRAAYEHADVRGANQRLRHDHPALAWRR